MTASDINPQEQIRNAMALFSAVFHKNPEAATLTRVSDGLLVEVNDVWLAMTGFSRAEVIGKTTLELGVWGDTQKRDDALAPLGGARSSINIEATMITKGGVKRPVRFNGTRFLLDGVAHMLGFIGDINEQGHSARETKEKLDFIEQLTRRVPVLLYQFRLRSNGSGHFPYVTRAFQLFFGLAADEVMDDASKAFKLVHPDDFAPLWHSIKNSARDLTHWHQEFRVKHADGTELWLSGDSLPTRQDDGSTLWYGSITDVTRARLQFDELEKTREQMSQKANALRIALENMSQGMVTMDAAGTITLYNQQFLQLLDLPQSLMTDGVNGSVLTQFQTERGDFGPGFELLDPKAKDFVMAGDVLRVPDHYFRKTRAGMTLQIKSRALPDGGVVRTFTDVSHFVDAQAALHQSETRFRSLTALSSDWYWEQDENFRFVRVDGNNLDAENFPTQQYVGKSRWELGYQGLTELQWSAHRDLLNTHQIFRNLELQSQGLDGKIVWSSINGSPIFDDQGKFRGYRGIGRDITEQKRVEDESQRLAFYDTLTGLPNRRLLLDRLSKALVTSGRNQSHGALLFIDLDNFKDLNDTQGHDIGDQLLERVANRLVTCIRQGDTVARLGGDEFVVMLEDLNANVSAASTQVTVVADKILAALNLPFELSGKAHYSTPSIGITLFNGTQHSVDELLKRADLAMYQSKAAGRNTLRFFDPDMQASVAARAALEVDLRHGLEHGELLLYYQPVVNLDGKVTGVEALVRWHHPVRGLVAPADFISVAEQTGLILILGQWVLKAACAQLVMWGKTPATKGLSIAVNISAKEFQQAGFVQKILEVLRESGANPANLKLELTETLLLNDVQDAITKMNLLRGAGVRFSLDDFGTGYSSLAYLKQLPLDQLKIDQSFVRDVLTDPNDAVIARTIVALAHSLGLSVVAEGVETEGQRNFLAECGCKLFQGYLFGRPVAVNEVNLDAIATAYGATTPHSVQG